MFTKTAAAEQFDCAHLSNYKIPKTQYVASLASPVSYLVCEPVDKSTKKPSIILMVAQEFKRPGRTSLKPENFYTTPTQSKKYGYDLSSSLLTYQLHNDGSLMPESAAARYYLAMRYLWQQRYDLATAALATNLSVTRSLTSQERLIINWILKGNYDHDVRAGAVRLNAMSILVNNFLHYSKKPSSSIYDSDEVSALYKKTQKLYDKYLSRLSPIGEGLIDTSIERGLNKWLSDFNRTSTMWPAEESAARIVERAQVLDDKQSRSPLALTRPPTIKSIGSKQYGPRRLDSLKAIRDFIKHSPKFSAGLLTRDANPIVDDNFGVFYRTAYADSVLQQDRHDALMIISKVLMIDFSALEYLSNQELVDELMNIARIAATSNQGYESIARWLLAMHARAYNPAGIYANYYELLTLAGMRKLVEVDDLIYAPLKHDLQSFYDLGGSLSVSDAQALKEEIIAYLIATTTNRHKQRVLDGINNLVAMHGHDESSSEFTIAMNTIVDLLNTKRAYVVNDHIEYLVMEHFKEILLREKQALILDTLQISQGRIGKPTMLGQIYDG